MNVAKVLDAISSGDYILELTVTTDLPEDTVIWGAVSERTNPSGLGRREFAFRGEDQKVLLAGIAEIINVR